jgi:hypothetical protein
MPPRRRPRKDALVKAETRSAIQAGSNLCNLPFDATNALHNLDHAGEDDTASTPDEVIHAAHHPQFRASARAAAGQPKEKFDPTSPFTRSNSRTRMYGDTAVRHWLTEQGPPTIGNEVWVKLNGSWQLVHVQFTPQVQR